MPPCPQMSGEAELIFLAHLFLPVWFATALLYEIAAAQKQGVGCGAGLVAMTQQSCSFVSGEPIPELNGHDLYASWLLLAAIVL